MLPEGHCCEQTGSPDPTRVKLQQTTLWLGDFVIMTWQAVMAVFRGLKKYPAPQGMNMYRLSAHELCKALLAFFDGGGYWPSGLHSQIPACQEWALKTARGLVKLAHWSLLETFCYI